MIALIDNQIFDGLKKAINKEIENVTVVDVFQDAQVSGDIVTFYEADYRRTEVTMNYKDPFSLILFQIDIYTEGNKRRSRSKTIQKVIDEYMFGQWHMKLIVKRPIQHTDNIYRVTMQYQALIREDTGQLLTHR